MAMGRLRKRSIVRNARAAKEVVAGRGSVVALEAGSRGRALRRDKAAPELVLAVEVRVGIRPLPVVAEGVLRAGRIGPSVRRWSSREGSREYVGGSFPKLSATC